MAAKSLENANKVWLRLNLLSQGYSPGTRAVIKAIRNWLATQKGNSNLQILTLADVTTDAAQITTGGELVYLIVLKKGATATDAYFKANNSATLAGAASGANMQVCIPLLDINDEVVLFYPAGLNLSTGLTVASETTGAGGSDTVSGDGPNGFIVIG